MIHGIGTDIVHIPRIQTSLDRFGARFSSRILSQAEHAEFIQSAHPAAFLAKRFAAKEAAVKALGTGFSQGIGFHDVAVAHDPLGRPLLRFAGQMEIRCRQRGIRAAHLSLSDDTGYAVAFVILEGEGEIQPPPQTQFRGGITA